MFKRIYLGVCLITFITVMYFAFITFQPIRNVKPTDVSAVTGIVSKIQQGSGGDIYIHIKNDPHKFYINNALNQGLTIKKLETIILEKEVTLYHINRWTPVSTDRVFPHISKVTSNGNVLFNEIIE